MKRLFLIILVIATLLSLSACMNEFTFRGNSFGDSIEQVKKTEGKDGEISNFDNFDDYQTLYYSIEGYNGYESSLYYFFKDNELKHICESFYYYRDENKETIEDVYTNLKKELTKYENPTEESKDASVYKAFWENDKYGIVLLVTDSAVVISYSLDSNKAKIFYTTNRLTDLLGK